EAARPVGRAAGGGLVVVAQAGTMPAMRAGDGAVRGRAAVGTRSGPSLAGDSVVLLDGTIPQPWTLTGYRLTDGQRRWQVSLPPATPLVLTDEPLIVIDLGFPAPRTLLAVDPATGAI